MSSRLERKDYITPIVCIMIGICYWFIMQDFTYTGDDLRYLVAIQNRVPDRGPWLAFPASVYSHWLTVNGRLSNLLMPVFLSVKFKMLTDLLMAVAISAMLWVTVRAADLKRSRVTLSLLLITLIVLTLPWWDSLLLYCCWFSYPISAAVGIAAALMILRRQIEGFWSMVGAMIFAFAGGAMHEACGVALAAGLLVYVAINHRSVSRRRKILTLVFVLGTLMPLTCPAAWGRLETAAGSEYSMWEIVSKSAFYALVLMVWIAIPMLTSSGRRVIWQQMHSEWCVWVVAALVSTCFCAISGILGRSGFFAQIFALIAFFYQFGKANIKIKRNVSGTISLLLGCILIVHFAMFIKWQHRCGSELKSAIESYAKSDDGIVYIDYTPDAEVPWWLLHKVRGVPDADDLYILQTIRDYYKPGGPEMLVLPTAVENMNAANVAGMTKVGNNNYITAEKPQTHTFMTYEKIPLLLMDANLDGAEVRQYVVQPFCKQGRQLWYLSLRDIDPGDE